MNVGDVAVFDILGPKACLTSKVSCSQTGHSLTTFTAKRDIFNGLKLHLTHPFRWVTWRRAGVAQVLSHPGQLD